MHRFKDKVVLITGGNSGIGQATAKLFKQEGAEVIITGRDEATLKATAAELDIISIKSDTKVLSDIDELMETVKQQFGRIDVLFVNAGIAKIKQIQDVTEKDYDQIMNINLKGAFFTVQKALPLLQKGSSIIFNSSISGQLGEPGTSIYAASKAALRSFGRTMSAELVDRGIRVNVISPGPIDTPIFERKTGINAGKEMLNHFASMTPMKRAGNPDEVAKAVAFLASDDSSYILGVDLEIDGGIVAIGA